MLLSTLADCELAVSVYPTFSYNAAGGGGAGSVTERDDGLLNILAAIPDDWQTGEFTGLKARGGFEVDVTWAKGQVTRLVIRSALGGNCRIAVPNALKLNRKAPSPARGENTNAFYKPVGNAQADVKPLGRLTYDVPTEAGKEYVFTTR